MSAEFDDLVDQVQTLQDASDNNQPVLDNLSGSLDPDGTIRAQLQFPADPTTVQIIQEAAGNATGSTTGGSIVSSAAGTFFPSGWTMSHDGTGLYTVYHTLATSSYAVTVSPNIFHTSFAVVNTKTSTSFSVATFVWSSGAATDTDFDFIVTS